MKFSRLTLDDLEDWENENAANPANPANVLDLKGNALANLLLIDANPLLIEGKAESPKAEISSGLANFSNGLANQEFLITDKKQTDTESLAELATLAASANPQIDRGVDANSNGIKHDTLENHSLHALAAHQPASDPRLEAALAVLQTLYAQHVDNLVAGGFDGKGALVHRRDYWQALHQAGIPPDVVFELLDQGRIRTQADGLYWVPVEVKP